MSVKPTILLVEDDRDQAMLFAQVLSLAGYEVETTYTAEEAAARLTASRFAMLLADWDLPGMNGDTLIAAVREQYPAMKSVLYSNHMHVDDAAEACGADAWFRKTEGIVRLREVVRALLPPSAGG